MINQFIYIFFQLINDKFTTQYPVFSPAFILAPVKESRGRHKEAEEALGDPREKSTTLFCTYCLSEDQKWIIASATDELGEILETITINIEIPNRLVPLFPPLPLSCNVSGCVI